MKKRRSSIELNANLPSPKTSSNSNLSLRLNSNHIAGPVNYALVNWFERKWNLLKKCSVPRKSGPGFCSKYLSKHIFWIISEVLPSLEEQFEHRSSNLFRLLWAHFERFFASFWCGGRGARRGSETGIMGLAKKKHSAYGTWQPVLWFLCLFSRRCQLFFGNS